MATIEERARKFADRHEEAELNLRGLGGVYGYDRIKNAEICAYERGANEQKKIDIDKALEYLEVALQCGVHPCNKESFIMGFKKIMEE